MPPHSALLRFAVAAALPLIAGAASAAPDRPPAAALAADAGQDRAALAVAQDREARAGASVDDLRRALSPGHLTDPMPDADRAFGLSALRSDYADAQRRAAGYRATLGDQHPTLRATEQMMEDLRAQLLAGTRRALASAEHAAADARAEVAAAERRLAAATAPAVRAPAAADVTGRVAAPAHRAASPLSLPPAAAPPVAAPTPAEPPTAADPAPASRRALHLLLLAAAAAFAVLLAGWGALRLLRFVRAAPAAAQVSRPRRGHASPSREGRVEPALAAPPSTPEPAREAGAAWTAEAPAVGAPTAASAGVPVLGRLSPSQAAPASGDALAGLHATLRAAFGDAAARMTVLVAPAAGLSPADADGAAFALAHAAAAAGRRPLLMEARARGRLRAALAPAGAVATAIEAGGAVRSLYRLGPSGAVALLPSDPGEAEAAALAAARPGASRLRGLDGFDTVVLVGDDAAALAGSADLVLLAAPADAGPPALDASARPLRAAARPCGALLVEPGAADPAVPAHIERACVGRACIGPVQAGPVQGAAPAPAAPRPAPAPRRRTGADPAPAVRLGLRGSFDPARRRAG